MEWCRIENNLGKIVAEFNAAEIDSFNLSGLAISTAAAND